MLCERGRPKTSFPLGWSFLNESSILQLSRNAAGAVRRCSPGEACLWSGCWITSACKCVRQGATVRAILSLCRAAAMGEGAGMSQEQPKLGLVGRSCRCRWKEGAGGASTQVQDCQGWACRHGLRGGPPGWGNRWWVGRVALLTRELCRKHFKINGLGNGLFNGSAAVLYLTASGLKGLLYTPSSVSHPVCNTCLSCAQSAP